MNLTKSESGSTARKDAKMNDYQALSLIIAAVCVFGALLLVLIGHLLRQAWGAYKARDKAFDERIKAYDRYHGDCTERDYRLGCRREMRTESGQLCAKCGGAV